ncbi:multisubunit sodium/proton antiporter MrpD subunit [Rhodoglobus vestalii]|uniref:Multisubunit sodium/proton antiporter MrpD subunit n=1 Tax=Rhodoglobus vestalii TaxID=193384 RepID=A0A8H2PYV7_9MICO|nr:monovalent cation/H+ antiporter subunit D family protein [Rhodoglobus vestalii]TQO20709.1 multisubunit sodium/proton antiporter MrpD subunit [Rhodoglobus vestalii]
MTAMLLPMFAAAPILVAGLLLTVGRRPRLQAGLLLTVSTASMVAGLTLIGIVNTTGVVAHGVGAWPFGIAIPLAADMFTALMLTATGLLTAVCSLFAITSGTADGRFFSPLVLVLLAGVNGALLTVDLFNLFVFIEVMLLPSYALLVLAAPGKGRLRQVTGARLYVTVNLLTSTVFLAGVAFIYGTAGTVNLAELAGAAHESDAVALAAGICLFALAIKAAVVPVHGWLARTYPSASPAVTALFSGLHTKVAIYAIYRIYAQLFEGDDRFLGIGIAVFTLTMIVGVFAAVGETTTRSILAFHMVSQIGYILIGIALFTGAGLAAGIFYLIHHMIVKAALFLSTGAIEVRYGTGALSRLGGMGRREPLIAVVFLIAAFSMAGLPPFSGFVAKLSLVLAAVDAGQIVVVIAMLAVSLVTLLSMLKIWSGVFWGHLPDDHEHASPRDHPASDGTVTVQAPLQARVGLALTAPAIILAALTILLGIGGDVLLQLADTAAAGLLDTSAYTDAVIGR